MGAAALLKNQTVTDNAQAKLSYDFTHHERMGGAMPNDQTLSLLERQRLLLEINNAVVAQLDLRALLQIIAPCLRRAIPHDAALLTLREPDSGQLRVQALDAQMFGRVPFEEGVLISPADTPEGEAMHTRQPVLVGPQVDLTRFSSPWVRYAVESGVQSGCAVPLIAHDCVLGALSIMSTQADAFAETEAELLNQCASQIAIAVENALNFQRAQAAEQQATRQAERLELLLQVNNAIATALDLPSLFRTVSACLRQVFRHDYAVMGLYDECADALHVHTLDDHEGIKILQEGQIAELVNTPVGLAIRTKQVVVTGTDYLTQFPSEVVRRAVSQGIRANCSAPLLRQNCVIGAMSMASRTETAFTREDGELFMQIANQVAIAVENALAYREIESLKNRLNEEKLYLEEEISTERNFEQIIGASGSLKRILKQVETVAPADSTVLIRGETGTGKELIARAIHNLSGRQARTLVKLNCAAIPTGLLESELFGHEKGAFTGAIAQRIGRFELAHKGTLFLDEVGDIPLELQPKLLRVLQEQEFERLGSARTQRVDVRVVAATNCDLEQMVADKQFRGDLFYRLNVFPITLPPLRERREDIPLLVRFFAQRFAQRMRKAIETIPAEAIARLSAYHWPGNVRELENVIERAVILSRGPQLEIPDMPKHETAALNQAPSTGDLTLAANEREHILRALRETDWVVGGASGAAARLGMNRTTLQSRMRKLGITRPK